MKTQRVCVFSGFSSLCMWERNSFWYKRFQ